MSNKFPTSQRIKKEKEISFLLKNGRRWNCDIFATSYYKNNRNFDRVAIIVSRKNGSAVYRNKLKRVFREVFRHTKVLSPPFYDILICPRSSSSVKTEIIKESYEKWRKELKI